MIFAFSEDGMVSVLENEAAAKVEFEAIDVENGVVSFYAEDGAWLKPRFARPNKRKLFGFVIEQGEFELAPEPSEVANEDPFEVAIGEARGVKPNLHFKSLSEIRDHVERHKNGNVEK